MDFTEMLNEFAEARKNGFITTKELKEEGKKVIGVYCGFAPCMWFGGFQERSKTPDPAGRCNG